MAKLRKYRQHLTALVALSLLALSLRHLSAGIAATTGSPSLESWLMAIGIDLAMVAAEIAILCGLAQRWASGLIVATLALSGGFNCLAFLAQAQGELGQLLAVSLGVFVPSSIYALIQILGSTPKRAAVRARAAKPRSRAKPQLRSVA